MVIMDQSAPLAVNRCYLPSYRWLFILVIASLATASVSRPASAYVLNGKTWPTGSNIVLQLGLGTPAGSLSDGSASWNSAVLPVVSTWNQQILRVQLSAAMDSTAPISSGDGVNSVVFANSVFGQSFGNGTLAVTYYRMQGANMIEADVLFNRAQTFDSYRGPLRYGGNGYAIGDIRRVFLHELGHGIGLNHQAGDHVMSATTSDREALSNDDIAGAQAMYGAPAAPTPTPPPTGSSRLVNISTRMKVGVGDDVLIGGFIIQGTQPKKMLLRAAGPSLTASGVPGAMQDPVLRLHDATGAVIAEDDNWQTGGQGAEISAAGLGPGSPNESALIATLQPGSYTAILQGRNGTQGVALVEGYELDATTTRLVNLSTRGQIGLGDDVLIGGIIIQGSTGKKVVVRALGPSLAGALSGSIGNPSLEMYNSSGQVIASNDNWTTSAQAAEITASGLPPDHPLESAILTTLAPGSYTAIVRGVNNGTGIGLVEIYDLEP